MEWELFVDESGSFNPGEHCLVGGFLCPAGRMNEQVAASWNYDIQQDPYIKEALEAFGNWKFDHCCENQCRTNAKKRNRGVLQTRVIETFSKKLEAIGGKLVLFDHPSGTANVDNTTTFLSVLAKGLMMLYYDLQADTTSLKVHFASRRNNTRQDDHEALLVSPTRVRKEGITDAGVILPIQYANQISNLAFLQGGQALLNDKVFGDMIKTIDIITDTYKQVDYDAPFKLIDGKYEHVKNGGNYDKFPNALTIPCDYICNTFFKGTEKPSTFGDEEQAKASLHGLYSPEHCRYYSIDRPLQQLSLDHLMQKADVGVQLVTLITKHCCEPFAKKVFETMNHCSLSAQKAAVDYVNNSVYEQVKNQVNMTQLVKLLDEAIPAANAITNADIQNYFVANLLLFQHSLYTHLGDQDCVKKTFQKAHETIEKLSDDSLHDTLLDMIDNRHIVDLTDLFDYTEALKQFDTIKKYWDNRIAASRRVFPSYPAYGRAIGSYLQLLRHVIHTLDDDMEKELYYDDALEKFKDYLQHIGNDPKEIARGYQTMCDIESEVGHFEQAMKHLYHAAMLSLGEEAAEQEHPTSEAIGQAILKSSANDGTRDPYMLQHFVRLIAAMYEAGKSVEAELLSEPLFRFMSIDMGNSVHSPHPRTQIQWKAASLLANKPGTTAEERQLSKQLFDAASNDMEKQGTVIFEAIAVGVRAEQAMHILLKHIPGNEAVVCKAMLSAYDTFVTLKPEGCKDPFAKIFAVSQKKNSFTVAEYQYLVRMIAY